MAHEPGSSAGAAGLSGRDLIGLGGLLVGAIVVGTVVGLVIDHATDTSPVFTLVGIGVGMLVAVIGFVAKVRTALHG